ncbi:MAG: DNA-binding protein [Bacteroidales bacterium]|nr:DNA-binding protein [Bacteroidales bacterium]
MKAKYIIASLAAACALAIGCTKETPTLLDEIQVDSSYIGLTNNEGTNSKTITVTAKDSWSINAIPEWLTINPMSGTAGETKVTFSAEKAPATRENTIKISCAGKEQTIIIKQEAEKVEPKTLNVEEAIKICKEYPAGSPVYRVKGIVCKINEISVQYGNATFFLSDNGKFEDGKWLEVYRGLWIDGAAFTKGDEFSVGDELIIEGVLMDYNGTPETKEKLANVYQVNKSLIKCDSLVFNGVKLEALPIEGGNFEAALVCKGNGVSVTIPDDAKSWLSVTGIQTAGEKATVTFLAAKNETGDRSTELTFTTTDGSKNYSAVASLAQKGAILEVTVKEFNDAPKSSTVYRVSGIVTKIDDATKGNFHFKDYSAETYAYKATNFAAYSTLKVGDIVTIIGNRDEYNGTIELTNGVIENVKPVTVKTAAEAIALPDDDKNDPKNYVMVTGVVTDGSSIPGHKFDLETYGNFELVDESGSAYVYGVSTGWKGETKKFGTLGVKEGDKLTIIAYKTSYTDKSGAKTDELVGMYVSHEAGETPEPPTPVVSEYSIDLKYTLGSNAYDDGIATINGTENQKVLKIGTSSKQGSLSVTVPAGAYGVSFYAIAWKGKATKVEFKVGDQAVSKDIAPNDGATGNSPYTITVSDTDKYEINFGGSLSADTEVTVTTPEGTASDKCRAIFFGVKALTDKK